MIRGLSHEIEKLAKKIINSNDIPTNKMIHAHVEWIDWNYVSQKYQSQTARFSHYLKRFGFGLQCGTVSHEVWEEIHWEQWWRIYQEMLDSVKPIRTIVWELQSSRSLNNKDIPTKISWMWQSIRVPQVFRDITDKVMVPRREN